MKRIFTLLLALVIVLALTAPALAAEDTFEAPEAEKAAVPEAPEAPVEETTMEEAAGAELPDLPQAAAAEPDTAAGPQAGKLTLLGELDKLWCVRVIQEAGETDYMGQFDATDILLEANEAVELIMDYRYTARLDPELESTSMRGVLGEETPAAEHIGDIVNVIIFGIGPEDSCDVTVTIAADPDAPALIPLTWTAPAGVYVDTADVVVSGDFGAFTCDKGYVPLFIGAEPQSSLETTDGRIMTLFEPFEDAESIHVDVKKATGWLNFTGFADKVVMAVMADFTSDISYVMADANNGLIGGALLTVCVEAGYDITADVEFLDDAYAEYEGTNVHIYYMIVPAAGDIHAEVVKTDLPVDPPKSGTGWAYDEATGDYYYFVDGVQKFNCWTVSQRGLWYYIGPDGKLATGFQYVKNNNGTGWYMFQSDDTNGCIGRMLTGWQQTYTKAGMGWFNTAHGGVNGQCTYTTAWGDYNAATSLWSDGLLHQYS